MVRVSQTLVVMLLVAGVFAVGTVKAANIEALSVDRSKGRIYISADIFIAAPRPGVFAALSDYERFSELSDRFVESRFVEPAEDGTPRIYTVVEGCILFYCRQVKRHARLEKDEFERIVVIAEPDISDLEYGREEWLLESTEDGTRILYTHVMDPDFWVPPVIGVWAIKRTLRKAALASAQRVESLALDVAGSAPD